MVLNHQKRTFIPASKQRLANMNYNKRSGFTLLEILVVMVFIGIFATMAIPRLIKQSPDKSWVHVTYEINNLIHFARQESIATQKIYRLAIIKEKETRDILRIEVETESDEPKRPGKRLYTPAYSEYYDPTYKLPNDISVISVFKDKDNILEGQKIRKAYCHIIPQGLVEEVLIHLTRREDDGSKSKISLRMAPFMGVFSRFDGHIKSAGKKQ